MKDYRKQKDIENELYSTQQMIEMTKTEWERMILKNNFNTFEEFNAYWKGKMQGLIEGLKYFNYKIYKIEENFLIKYQKSLDK